MVIMKILICKNCGSEYGKWIPENTFENNLCLTCNEAAWKEWEKEEADNLKRIEEIQKQGHPHHCACRQVWGDGECECDLYKKGYDPYAWAKGTPTPNR
jgi:hypothetical protein